MDNFGGFNNLLPPALALYLTNDLVARDKFYDMDDERRGEFMEYSKEFQSKEELERFLYHHDEDNFQ
ncbi:hypothetical protein SAMN02745136_00839 [Anaerocolumna jejuensis DSM 15929]|jgi:hypothetical protein|uniref:Uncharacterized protein n=1 Tax=Anaerocolumna jejuensis DSM 15929 TaxID=1121322 RepID=A0A1M6M4U9_9FIRM|nr:hypothetical protein [Anaerocolumna jejuensis]SHJ78323.1 hypothetical protein SAMN02745136_00839 [Anaerocolumna jejuensis DSM 15929]